MEHHSVSLSSCDDSYLVLLESSTNSHTRDEIYEKEFQLQETTIGSILHTTSRKRTSDFSDSSPNKRKATFGNSPQVLCEICAENRDCELMFAVPNCVHVFCTECIRKNVEVKLQQCPSRNMDNARLLPCLGFDCKGVLEIDTCRHILPENVISMWEDVVSDSLIDSSPKFYCPYKDCSELIVNDSSDREIEESECPFCHRLFCASCGMPWHLGIECEEFSKQNEDESGTEDLTVYELAKKNKWRRCSRCNFFVEKTDGCLHISCRCGHQFCYACGAMWNSSHGGCQG